MLDPVAWQPRAATYAVAIALLALVPFAVAAAAAPMHTATNAASPVALFSSANGVGVGAAGDVYVADTSNEIIRKIALSGVVTTIAGTPRLANYADGQGGAAVFNAPASVAVDSAGNVYVGDTLNNAIREISPTGLVTTLAGSSSGGFQDGPAASARFAGPWGVAVDSSGTVYVADRVNDAIRKISGGMVTTLAGGNPIGGSLDGTGTAAQFNYPDGVAVDANGFVYVADTANNIIRKITPNGVVTTIAGTALVSGNADGNGSAAQFNRPTAIAVDASGNLFVCDNLNGAIRKITPNNDVTTLATGFDHPYGVAVAPDGSVYVAHTNVDTIDKVMSSGHVFPYGGTTGVTGFNDGVTATPPGDANGDDQVTSADVVSLISHLFANGPAIVGPPDVNADQKISAGDVFYLINYIFAGGGAPQ